MKTKTGKLRKRILAFLLAALLAIYPIASVLPQFAVMAGDELTGSGWWTDTQSSTAQILSDGGTIAFSVQVKTSDALAEGEYAAFCVEATDGTSYFTATSDGDCWGAGTDTDGTSTGVVAGGSYTVTISRDGNDFTADIVDDATSLSILENKMYLEGTTDFGDTSCYIVSQVGDLSVSVISIADELVGHATDWWTTTNKSTAISLPDGYTISWNVKVVANDGQTDGDGAAFLVEANDGTSYCSAATNGDIWGNGSDTDDTEEADVSFGNTYAVSIARSDNDFTVTIKGDDADMVMSLVESDSSVDFSDMTCYIMSQVGDLTVELVAITGPQEETVVGDTADWWQTTKTSTAISLTDGSTITWDVTLVANDSQADGVYGAFLAEATDGASYCTATSDGDCWGAGTDTDDKDNAGVSFGNTYRVIMARSGNNFTVTITGTDAETTMSLEGTSDFGETTCYIMSQVGNLTVLSYAITEDKEFSTAATSVSVSVNTDEDAVSGTTSTTVSVHDPSIVKGYVEKSVTELSADTEIVGVKDDTHTQGIYFIFGSHLAWAYSWDLVSWTTFTNNLNTYYETIFATEAAWAALGEDGYTVDGNMWAPDVIWNTDMQCWCMYMSINGNSWNSSICLLTSESLYGSWTYVGTVIYSGFTAAGTTHDYTYTDYADVTGDGSLASRYWLNNDSSTWNYNYGAHAIDPCVTYDEEGNLWMSYGSWSGGIYMIRLDKETGLRDSTLKYDTETNVSDEYMGYQIAGGNFASGEGSYIEYYNGYYYLFVSYGFYDVDGGYNMRVFRSKSINGSYVDESGDSAIFTSSTDNYTYSKGTHTYGMRLMSQYKWSYQTYAQVAQGHNSVYYDEDTDQIYLVYHTKTNDGTAGHYVNVHQLFQNEDGWLVTAPFTYQKETTTNADVSNTDSDSAYSSNDIAGNYEVIVHELSVDYANLAYVDPVYIVLDSDGSINGDLTGTWTVTANTCYITLVIDGETYQGVLSKGTLEDKGTKTLTFSAVGASSEVAIWGYRYTDADIPEMEAYIMTLPAQTVNGTALDLATAGTYGATISWESSNTDVIAIDGTVTVPTENIDVTLTATISYDGADTVTKTFTVTVIGSNSVDEDGNITVWSSTDIYDLTNATQGTYDFVNYFNETIGTSGLDLSGGVSIKFTVNQTGDYNLFSNVLGFTVDGDTSANIMYFTGGSYLGYNATGGYFDANVNTTTWAAGTNYIGSGTDVEFEIVITSTTYEVYAGSALVYSKGTVDAGDTTGDYSMDSMSSVLSFLSEKATEFDLGWGSWWSGGFAGTISNITLTAYAAAEDATDVEGYLYKQTFVSLAGTTGTNTGWYSAYAQSALSVVTDSNETIDWYLDFAADSTASGPRGAYLALNDGDSLTPDGDTYTVRADVAFTNYSGFSQNQFVIMGAEPTTSSFFDSTAAYRSVISSDYIVLLNQTATNTYTVNDSSTEITISSDTWVTITAYVNKNEKKAYVTIIDRDTEEVLFEEEVSFDVEGELYGIYLTKTRNYGAAKIDNIGVSYSVGSRAADGTVNDLTWYDYTNFFGVDVTEDFAVTWKFINYSNEKSYYQNYAVVAASTSATACTVNSGSAWYLRADNYSNDTFSDSTVAYSNDWDWNDFTTMMNGAEVSATLVRDGDTMTFSATILGSNDTTYTYTATAKAASTEETLTVYLGGEDCYLVIEEYSVTDDVCHYSTKVTEPTCTEEGYTTYTCIYCGATYTSDTTDATGHTYSTTENDDYTTHTCSVCGDTYNTITVVVNALSTTGTSVSATLTGGGSDYVVGDDVTVGAPGVTNYSFIGWYNADGTDEEGYATGYDDSKVISSEQIYTFTASTNVSLVAVYRADSAMSLTVKSDNLNGAAYSVTVDSEAAAIDSRDDFTADYEAGASVTLTAATDVEGVAFAYWMNGSSKIVGTEKTYTFTIVADTVIYPVYNVSGSSNNTAIVDYVTYYGQVLVRYTYTSDSTTVTAPSTLPTRTGYTFSGWSMSETEIVEEIKGGTTSIEVTPKYTKDSEKYTVNVYTCADNEAELSETYSDREAGDTLTVKAPGVSDKVFQYWADGMDGTILSYKESYMVYLSQNIDLYAVYGDGSVTDAASTIVMTNVYAVTESTSDSDTTCKIAFEATRSVLEGYTVLETGFLLSTNSSYASSGTLVIGAGSNDDVTRYISSSTERDGVFTLYVDMTEKTDTTVYAVGYMVISDGNGNLSYCYTDVRETTYNNLNSKSTE